MLFSYYYSRFRRGFSTYGMLKMTKIHTSNWVILGAFAKTVNFVALMIHGHTTSRPSSEDNSKESGPTDPPCEGVRKAREAAQRHTGSEPASQGQALPHAQRRTPGLARYGAGPRHFCTKITFCGPHMPPRRRQGARRSHDYKNVISGQNGLFRSRHQAGAKGHPIRCVPLGGVTRVSLVVGSRLEAILREDA